MAGNSEVAAKRRRGPGRPFRKGVSGNPFGRPRAALDVRDLARQHTSKAIDTLVRALDDEKLCVSAAVHLLERGWRRPIAAPDSDETEDRDTTFVLRIISAQDQSVDGSNGTHLPRVITIPTGDE
jgi:hypothetical protein